MKWLGNKLNFQKSKKKKKKEMVTKLGLVIHPPPFFGLCILDQVVFHSAAFSIPLWTALNCCGKQQTHFRASK